MGGRRPENAKEKRLVVRRPQECNAQLEEGKLRQDENVAKVARAIRR